LRSLIPITRANFLPLTLVIVLAGLAAALHSQRTLNGFDALLVLIGGMLTHASVNAFNNYFDYKSKIDAKTTKTPFSGGINVLVQGIAAPKAALATALVCLIGALFVGAYFLARLFYVLLPLILYGLFVIVLYTPVLSRIHGVSEIVAGSGFGFMGLGTYATQAGVIDSTGVAVFVPVTILVAMLLFLNEFPDADVDRAAGRRHVVILLGRKNAAFIYVSCLVATYVSIVLSVVAKAAPFPVLVSLATVPIAYKASKITLKNYDKISELIPALGANVLMILSTISLLAAGFTIGYFIGL